MKFPEKTYWNRNIPIENTENFSADEYADPVKVGKNYYYGRKLNEWEISNHKCDIILVIFCSIICPFVAIPLAISMDVYRDIGLQIRELRAGIKFKCINNVAGKAFFFPKKEPLAPKPIDEILPFSGLPAELVIEVLKRPTLDSAKSVTEYLEKMQNTYPDFFGAIAIHLINEGKLNLLEVPGIITLQSGLDFLAKYGQSLKRLNISHINHDQLQVIIDSCPNLKILDLSFAEINDDFVLPPSFDHLESLRLGFCANLKAPKWIGDLKGLKALNIEGCVVTSLDCLSSLTTLETLILISNPHLSKISDWISNLEELKILHLAYTDEEDLDCLHLLSKLETLELICNSHLSKISDLTHFPELKHLKLHNLPLLQAPTLSSCVKMESLDLYGLTGPIPSLAGLAKLNYLSLVGFSDVELDLTEQTHLQKLRIRLRQLASLTGFDHLHQLKELELTDCRALQQLDLSAHEQLELLDLRHTPQLRWITDKEMRHLKNLHFHYHGGPLPKCGALHSLEIAGGTATELQITDAAPQLKVLSIQCSNINSIEGLDNFTGLETFYLHNLPIKKLPKMQANPIKHLRLQSLSSLTCMSSVKDLKELKTLHIHGCPKLVKRPRIKHLEKLEELHVRSY